MQGYGVKRWKASDPNCHALYQVFGAIVLVVGILGLVELYRGRIKSIGGLPLADWVVLFVGLIAFLAVMIQIEEQQNARKQEGERHKRAVATGLLAEIEDFKKHHIDPVRDRPSEETSLVKIFDESPFTIYEMNAADIGELEMRAVQSIVHFYDLAKEYLAARRRSQENMEAALLPGAQDDKWGHSIEFHHDHVRIALDPLCAAAQEATKALHETVHTSHG